MVASLAEYTRKHEYLICVDSDGCAMDTMDIKHIECFGPCMVAEWGLEQWSEPILKRWNDINLYTMTRGINRFKALSMALQEIDQQYCRVEDLDTLVDWVEVSDELSNSALERAILANAESVCLRKALSWTKAVNQSINALPDEKKLPFAMAKEALAFAHERADVAIVSSANLDAVLEEWERYGLLEHTDIVLAQNAGSKAFCIGELLKKGYERNHVLMCGDAPGDHQAAMKNGVFYYPILVRREKESWEAFMAEGFDKLLSGEYAGSYQQTRVKEFLANLGGK